MTSPSSLPRISVHLFLHLTSFASFVISPSFRQPISFPLPRSNSPVSQSGRIKSKVLHPPSELIRPWRDEKRRKEHKESVNGFALEGMSERISLYLVDYLISFLTPAK